MNRTSHPPGDRCRASGTRTGFAAAVLFAGLLAGAAAAQPPAAGLPTGSTAIPLGVPGPAGRLVAQPEPVPSGNPVVPGLQPSGPSDVPPAAQPPGPYAGPLSNPLLSPGPQKLGRSPVPTPATREKIDRYVERLLDPESTLDLIAGQTRGLVLKNPPFRVQAGDPSVIEVNATNPTELLVQGKQVGATVLNLWFGDKDDPATQETLTYLVRVFPDPEAKERLERAYQALEDELNRHFTDSRIKLKVLGDKLVVSGRVRDYVQGGQILRVIRANMGTGGDVARLPVTPAGGVTDPTGATNPPSAEDFLAAGGPDVINLLEVAGEQQVMLRVVVAEVNRSASRTVGMNFSVTNQQGVTVFANRTGPVIGGLGGGGLGGSGGFGGFGGFGGGGFGGTLANLTATFDAGRIPFALAALKSHQYARSLAEPTLVTLNGVTANFLAGGQFPVPVIGGFGGFAGGLQGVSYVPFGVQLNFTPFITDRDRIRLVLNAAVSTRDLSSGTNIGGGLVAGLNSRNVSTTVELRQGETLAVAGLIQYNLGGDSTKIPFLGDIPGLNVLTGLHRVQAGETELVIFVTPELTRPLDIDQVAKLPGYEILDPNCLEFYLMGRIEGHCEDYRSPIRTDLSRIKMYEMIEQTNVYGPAGYSPQQYP